jgi:hypothetical protein
VWLEVDVEGVELDRPLGDPLGGIQVVEYITERVVGDHKDQVLLEVVS